MNNEKPPVMGWVMISLLLAVASIPFCLLALAVLLP